MHATKAYTAPEEMSIYQSHAKRTINVASPVTRGGTPTPDPVRSAGQVSTQDWSRLRKAAPVNYMLPASLEWVTSLPKNVRPWALVAQYPRIANALAFEWNKPVTCRAYFDDLLVDHRGNRKGFPADVHRDLLRLRDYYCNLNLTLDE